MTQYLNATPTGASQSSTYGYDVQGQLTRMVDPGGSTWSWGFDTLGHQVSATDPDTMTTTSSYDDAGNVLSTTDAMGSTLFLGETELHQASGSSDVSAVRTYSLAGKPVAERTTQPGVSGNGDLRWLGTDVDGTTDVEVDSTTGTVTRRYSDPFGNSRGMVPAWSSDHGFLNKTTDTSTGLTQLGARVYDATIGRFLSVDPILAPDNPQQNNGYDYSGNNPITMADPSGGCFVGSSDSFNHYTNCSTGDVNKHGQLPVSHGSTAAPGSDNGRIQGLASGSRPGRASHHEPVVTDAILANVNEKLQQVTQARTDMAVGAASDEPVEANWLAQQTLELAAMLPFAFEGIAIGPEIEGSGGSAGAAATRAVGADAVPIAKAAFRSDTSHIFRTATGHLAEDNPANREIIQSAIGPTTLKSTMTLRDGSTLSKYFRTLPDGTQAWAEVRNGDEITNGGLNVSPR